MSTSSIDVVKVGSSPIGASTRFSRFQPTKLLVEGKAKTLSGTVSDSVSVEIRSINGGQFTVQEFDTRKGAIAPQSRKLELGELRDLAQSLTRYMAKVPGRQVEFEKLNREIRNAIASYNVRAADFATNLVGPNAGANVESSFFVNLMPGPSGTAGKKAIGTVTLSGTGFNDAPPRYKVSKIRVYEEGTNTLVATIANPKVQSREIRRGMTTQTYRVEVPYEYLDGTKNYTFVADTGINGTDPKPVRSEFVPLTRAM